MYRRYKGPSDKPYGVCTVEATLENCFTELVFCGLPCFPFGCIIFWHCPHYGRRWKSWRRNGGWPLLDTHILNTFFLPSAEITAHFPGKMGANLPITEGLILYICQQSPQILLAYLAKKKKKKKKKNCIFNIEKCLPLYLNIGWGSAEKTKITYYRAYLHLSKWIVRHHHCYL